VYELEANNENLTKERKWRLERSHIKFILEVILMVVIGFLVLYPFFLFFFNFIS
jgi:hypothetical protein